MGRRFMVAGLLCTLGCTVTAQAGISTENLILNGSFESGIDPDRYVRVDAGDLNIDHWDVVSGSVNYMGWFWEASDGGRSLDMDGHTPGIIEQTFATVPGQQYEVTFDMAGNYANNDTEKWLRVNLFGGGESTTSADFMFDTAGHGADNMGWTSMSMTFTADSELSTLQFQSLMGATSAHGAALDNVGVFAVPAPGALALLGVAGFAGRRRRRH